MREWMHIHKFLNSAINVDRSKCKKKKKIKVDPGFYSASNRNDNQKQKNVSEK
jgi:hypothetical protein